MSDEEIINVDNEEDDDAMSGCSRATLVHIVKHAASMFGLQPVSVMTDYDAWIEFYKKDKCIEIYNKLVNQLSGTTLLNRYREELYYEELGAEESHFICHDKRLYVSVVMIYCSHEDGGWSVLVEVHSVKHVDTHQDQMTKIIEHCPLSC